MKRKILLILVTCLVFPLTGQETVRFPDDMVYDPFYAIALTDSDGGKYTLFNSFYQTAEGDLKYFVWFRRGTAQGLAEYPLDLYKIKRITLTGNYEVPPDGFTPCEIELTSGSIFEGFLDTTGYLAGMDQDFGSFGRIYLHYNGIRTVEFLHDGTYSRCPFCGSIFYINQYELCPFDQTPLVSQHSE